MNKGNTQAGKPLLPELGVIGLLLLLYTLCRATSFTFGDGLGFVAAIHQNWDWATNASSHLLYLNLQHILYQSLVPSLDAPTTLWLLSILGAGISLWRIAQVGRILAWSLGVRITTLLLFGLAFTFWRLTEIVEVYTFSLAFTSSALWAYLRFDIQGKELKNLTWASIWLALGLFVHIAHILWLPGLVWVLWTRHQQLNARLWVLVPILLAGLVLVGLPLITGTNSLSSILFDGRDSEVLRLTFTELSKGILLSLGLLAYNFGASLFFLFFRKKGKHPFGSLLLYAVVIHWAFAARFSALEAMTFYLPAYWVLALGIGQCLHAAGKFQWWHLSIPLVQPLLYLGVGIVAQNTPQLSYFAAAKAYKGGLAYYTYPWMNNNVDALQVSACLYQCQPDSAHADLKQEIAHSYVNAIKYLKESGQLHAYPCSQCPDFKPSDRQLP